MQLKKLTNDEIITWQTDLLKLKKLIGNYMIQNFDEEIFIKKDFINLLQFCHSEGMKWGLIINGSAFNHFFIKKLVAAKPTHIDISIDSATAEINDFIRGTPNSLNNITKKISILRNERNRLGLIFPIQIKPKIHFYNFRTLPTLVDWTKTVGATCIDFSPIQPVSKTKFTPIETKLWISKASDIKRLQQIIEILIIMKQEGAPIETSTNKLRSFPKYFLKKK